MNSDLQHLKLIRIPKCRKTDDDIAFDSDMHYFRDLLNAIVQIAVDIRFANPFPISLSDDLEAVRDWWPTEKAWTL